MSIEIPSRARVGTRGSQLALSQTAIVVDLLRRAWPKLDVQIEIISTHGDEVTDVPLPGMSEVGVFTSTLERALLEDKIDLAVHSVKDLPIQIDSGTVLGAIPPRASAEDVLVSRAGYTLETLPTGARIGTCSNRRAAQLRHRRPDLQPVDIRGNVDTRIQKALAPDSPFDAVVLARAGLDRLNRLEVVSQILPLDDVLPAPGQGALGVQCRDEPAWRALVRAINHPATEAAVIAERTFLAELGGGCSLPISAYATVRDRELHIIGRVSTVDGSRQIEAERTFPIQRPTAGDGQHAGHMLAGVVKAQGADELLEHLS